MSKKRYLGVTVFGYCAIMASLIFIGIHLWLLHVHQAQIADVIIGGLFILTASGFALIRASRNWLIERMRQVAYVWSFASMVAATLFFMNRIIGMALPPQIIWIGTAVILCVGFYNARYAEINSRQLFGNFSSELRVAHISDLHLGDIWGKQDVKRIVSNVNRLHPDVVLITGDVVDGLQDDTRKLSGLSELNAPTYAVIGNHDVYANAQKVKEALQDAEVTVLENDVVRENNVPIIGLGYKESHESISSQLKQAEGGGAAVVMKHEPDISQNAVTNETVLCGHTHGGQIWPLHLLGLIEFDFLSGSYPVNDGLIYVHKGTRTWGPPFRLGTKSEIALFQLTPDTHS
jgi:predicted MPP superfamily phosphohydrolase